MPSADPSYTTPGATKKVDCDGMFKKVHVNRSKAMPVAEDMSQI